MYKKVVFGSSNGVQFIEASIFQSVLIKGYIPLQGCSQGVQMNPRPFLAGPHFLVAEMLYHTRLNAIRKSCTCNS